MVDQKRMKGMQHKEGISSSEDLICERRGVLLHLFQKFANWLYKRILMLNIDDIIMIKITMTTMMILLLLMMMMEKELFVLHSMLLAL